MSLASDEASCVDSASSDEFESSQEVAHSSDDDFIASSDEEDELEIDSEHHIKGTSPKLNRHLRGGIVEQTLRRMQVQEATQGKPKKPQNNKTQARKSILFSPASNGSAASGTPPEGPKPKKHVRLLLSDDGGDESDASVPSVSSAFACDETSKVNMAVMVAQGNKCNKRIIDSIDSVELKRTKKRKM